jgi:peptidase E
VSEVRPTIVAASGGYVRTGPGPEIAFSPIFTYALELTGASSPKVGFLTTGVGDDPAVQLHLARAATALGCTPTVVSVFPQLQPNDAHGRLLEQDVIWVHGGSVANMLAIWRLHGLDVTLAAALASGVVLAGTSAGSLCWHAGGITRSFGAEPRSFDNGLAFIPYGNDVHVDSEPERRAVMLAAVRSGAVPMSYCTDDGVALIYESGRLVEAVAERPHAYATRIEQVSGEVLEHRIEPRIVTL